ncbi:hypothetical protein [Methylibium sp.]|uniref:hypothetical protein n=1 Tax=Methylibium sp. TaxID=2067992 RepID=UPI00333EEBED
MFDLASKLNLISNDRFAGLARWAEDLATSRVAGERIKCMAANELDEMVVDDTLAVPLHDELEHDWFAEFARTLPLIRNDHAHGSETVRFNVLRTFEVTAAMASSLSSALQEIEGAGLLPNPRSSTCPPGPLQPRPPGRSSCVGQNDRPGHAPYE